MPISSLLINFLLFMFVGLGVRRFAWARSFFSNLLKLAMFCSVVWLGLTAIGYLFTPLFFDHAEVNIASVAQYWLQGNSIYTVLDSAGRYSLLYGPWPYLVNAGFQSLGNSVFFLAKLPGVINLIALLGCFFVVSENLKVSISQRILSVGVLSSVLLGYYNFSYWNRPDSYLTTYVFLAFVLILNSEKFGQWFVYLGVGLLMGLAANCKVHGVLYFLPILIFFFESSQHRLSWIKLFAAGVVALVGLVGPFLFANVGAENYLSWLKMASKHGLVLLDFVKNLTFIGSFVLLLVMLGFQRRYRWTFGTLCFVAVIVALAASKPGAGTHHFMPFIPVIIYFALMMYFKLGESDRKRLGYIAAAFLLTMSLNAVNRQKRVTALFKQTVERKSELADLEAISVGLSGAVEVGYSDNANYEASFFKLALIKQQKGFLLDGAALMDMHASHVDVPDSTFSKVASCEIPYFVFPKKGEPWSLLSFYGDKPLFSEEFKATFNKAYTKERETDFYSIYSCKK
ncbi:MAG: ArnT family glycosyltransferase [Bdellovibrio sp.]